MSAEYQAFVRARSKPLTPSPVPEAYDVAVVEGSPSASFVKVARERPTSAINAMFGFLPNRPRTQVVVVRTKGRSVAGAVATPRWFRFPFMKATDLQLGDVWTDESHRRLGLAMAGCSALIDAATSDEGSMWWISDRTNTPSIELALRLGFESFGSLSRTSRFGTPLLGTYELGS